MTDEEETGQKGGKDSTVLNRLDIVALVIIALIVVAYLATLIGPLGWLAVGFFLAWAAFASHRAYVDAL